MGLAERGVVVMTERKEPAGREPSGGIVDYVALALEDMERWDSRLVELVKENKMDPWDIDIVLLTEKYMEKIEELSRIDFRIPGKAVLTASVLLRLKSEKISEAVRLAQEAGGEGAQSGEDYSTIEILPLQPIRRVVERKITILELVEALRDAFEVERGKLYRRRAITDVVRPTSFVMEEFLANLRTILSKMFGERETILLTDLVEYDEAFALLFLGLLHLASAGFVELHQESWNGVIRIERPKTIKEEASSVEVTKEEADSASP